MERKYLDGATEIPWRYATDIPIRYIVMRRPGIFTKDGNVQTYVEGDALCCERDLFNIFLYKMRIVRWKI